MTGAFCKTLALKAYGTAVVVVVLDPLLPPDATRATPTATRPTPAIQIQIGAASCASFTPAGLPGASAAWLDSEPANAAVLERSRADAKATAPNLRTMKNPPDPWIDLTCGPDFCQPNR